MILTQCRHSIAVHALLCMVFTITINSLMKKDIWGHAYETIYSNMQLTHEEVTGLQQPLQVNMGSFKGRDS